MLRMLWGFKTIRVFSHVHDYELNSWERERERVRERAKRERAK